MLRYTKIQESRILLTLNIGIGVLKVHNVAIPTLEEKAT